MHASRLPTVDLKTHMPVTKDRPRTLKIRTKVLETDTPVHKSCSQIAAEQEENYQLQGPLRGKSSSSRPRTAAPRPHARQARHARREPKTKTNTARSSGFGGVLTVLAPPNLRYMRIYYLANVFYFCLSLRIHSEIAAGQP